jgi:hypothetical protein
MCCKDTKHGLSGVCLWMLASLSNKLLYFLEPWPQINVNITAVGHGRGQLIQQNSTGKVIELVCVSRRIILDWIFLNGIVCFRTQPIGGLSWPTRNINWGCLRTGC